VESRVVFFESVPEKISVDQLLEILVGGICRIVTLRLDIAEDNPGLTRTIVLQRHVVLLAFHREAAGQEKRDDAEDPWPKRPARAAWV
jgi:hypothetical protein